jgi:DNA-binding MarR family transcriptional regulator
MVANELADVFLHKMPTSLLLTIRTYDRTYVSVLAKECNCTYPHAVKTLWGMEKLGLLRSEKVGRVKYVELTDHGRVVADSLNELVLSLGGNKVPTKNDAGHINQKINNVISKVEAIQKDLDAGNDISRDEAIHFNRRLGPYYRELNAIRLLLQTQPNSPLHAKVEALGRTLSKVKREIETKRMPQPTVT